LKKSELKKLIKEVYKSQKLNEDDERFDKADKAIHKVEDEWHYPILKKYGFEPKTKTGVGFVRKYIYVHPKTEHEIELSTGINADYWTDGEDRGYWNDLEPHLKKLSKNK